jgi:hypothetical protein
LSVKYRKLDSNGDYSFGFGNSNFLTGLEATTQAIKTKLNLFEGEWWENIADGLPFFQAIAGQIGTADEKSAIDLLIKNRILDVDGVTGIETFTSTWDGETRAYSMAATVNTEYGTAEVSTTV